MDVLIGLFFIFVVPAITYWRGRRSGYRRHAAQTAAAPAPDGTLWCQCGGTLAHHSPATGRCAHVVYVAGPAGPEQRACTCQWFVDRADPYSPPPPAYSPPFPPAA